MTLPPCIHGIRGLDGAILRCTTYHYPSSWRIKVADPVVLFPSALTSTPGGNVGDGADQLRQRVAFALSGRLSRKMASSRTRERSCHPPMTAADSRIFGNFRRPAEGVTLHPAMGLYLDMRGNDKGNITLGTHANENNARENPAVVYNRPEPDVADGTLVLDSQDKPGPPYE